MRAAILGLFFVCFGVSCQNNEDVSDVIEQDLVDVAQLSITDALVNQDVTDYTLIADPKNVVLADTLVSPEMLPQLDGIKITVMTQSQIQQKADADGDFVYLYFSTLELESSNSILAALGTTWAASSTSSIIYLSGGFRKYRFTRKNGVWQKELLAEWIS